MTKITNTRKKILINEKDLIIEKATLNDIIEVLEKIEGVPKDIMKIERGTSNAEFLKILPLIVANSIKEFSKAILILLKKNDIDERFILSCSAVDILELVYIILEVNEVERILELIKKIQGVGGVKMLKMATKK